MEKTVVDLMEEEGWLTVAEATKRSGFSRHTIHRLIREDIVESTRVGDRWFISRAGLADHFDTEPIRSRILGEL
jgi:excisionase family DNA binding protein